jgi:hypothetical protein
MQVPHAYIYLILARDVLYREQVAAVLNHKGGTDMPEKVDTALFRNPSTSLVVDYQAVNIFAVEP